MLVVVVVKVVGWWLVCSNSPACWLNCMGLSFEAAAAFLVVGAG